MCTHQPWYQPTFWTGKYGARALRKQPGRGKGWNLAETWRWLHHPPASEDRRADWTMFILDGNVPATSLLPPFLPYILPCFLPPPSQLQLKPEPAPVGLLHQPGSVHLRTGYQTFPDRRIHASCLWQTCSKRDGRIYNKVVCVANPPKDGKRLDINHSFLPLFLSSFPPPSFLLSLLTPFPLSSLTPSLLLSFPPSFPLSFFPSFLPSSFPFSLPPTFLLPPFLPPSFLPSF